MRKLLGTLMLCILVLPVMGAVIYPPKAGTGGGGTTIILPTYVTNYYLFTTNIYQQNGRINNYFETNVFLDVYMSNYYATNQYVYITNVNENNLTITNYYLDNTYISNFYDTNIFVNDTYVSNYFVTNLFSTTEIITTNFNTYNTFTNVVITNLFLVNTTTNYYLFSTNIYQSYPTYVNNTYVSNYFQTNAFLNTYVSNYFTTNQFLYLTNLYYYTTNLTVTNFYLTDNYISNFFNTNIFFVDNSVSNFFTTNIYNTINISSNYTYQYDLNLTNPVFYGEAWIDGYSDHPNPKLTILSPNGYPIELDGATGDIRASGGKFDTIYNIDWDWDGPTNLVELYTTEQFYNANTDCQITGFDLTTVPFGRVWNGTLTITNRAATNITLRLPAGLTITDNTNAVVVSNATRGMLWIKLGPRSGTNGVYRNYPQ